MGYRAEFLNNAGEVAAHSEAFLHLTDREVPGAGATILLAGVGNGGPVALWESCGSTVTVADFDVCDKPTVLEALRDTVFDVIIDATGLLSPWLWPHLREGGLYVYENLPSYEGIIALTLAVMEERDSEQILPVEEVLRVNVYGPVVSIEKRSPKVVPFVNIFTGNFAEVVSEGELVRSGFKRALTG